MYNRIAAVLMSVFAAMSYYAGPASGADWPCFRGPNHDGTSAEAIAWPKDGPKQVWKTDVGMGHSGVSVVGDRVANSAASTW